MTSTIQVTYDAADITTSVIFHTVNFEAQLSALPGTFEFEVKDPDQVLSFVTGKEVTLSTDGVLMFGGYVTQVTRKFAFPVVDTVTPTSDQVKQRIWTLRGVDYNILFDKLVLRNTADYLTQLPTEPNDSYDEYLIEKMFANYVDMPAGFNTTTLVDQVRQPIQPEDQDPASLTYAPYYAFKQQGSKLREQMDEFALVCGAIYYFNAAKQLVYRAVENSEAKWGFADVPNYRVVTASPTLFQGATYGFREVDIVEDGSAIIDDAFVWGGSAFAGTEGGTVFARAQNVTAIAKHGRWQASFTKFGEPLYKSQAGVDLLSSLIVSGSPNSVDPANGRGLVYPQFRISLAWFSDDVPIISGNRDHLRPGDLVTFIMYVLHDADHPQGLVLELPLRQIKVSVPTTENGDPYIRFDGVFGLQANDPFTIWRFLLRRQSSLLSPVPTIVTSSNNTSTSANYGSFGQFVPIPDPDGTTVVFSLPNGIGYINGTQEVYLNRLFQRPGFEYTPSDPTTGQITFATAPVATDSIFIVCRTTSGAGNGIPVIDPSYGAVFRKVFAEDATLSPFQVATYPDDHIGEPGQYMTVFNRFTGGGARATIHDGYLDLQSIRRSSGTLWDSVLLATSIGGNDVAHTYGYGVYRFWLRFNVGPGTWQSGWLYDTTNWTATEIDWPEMLENLNLDAHVIGTGAGAVTNVTKPVDIWAVFHEFKIERRATFVAFSIDGVEVGRITNSMPSDSLAILLDSKVGFPWMGATGQIGANTPNPAYLHVAGVTVDA